MRRLLMAMAVAVMAAIGFAAPVQATVSSVNMPFGMAYGNSTTSGTIHFTDGYSASVSGAVMRRAACAWSASGGRTAT